MMNEIVFPAVVVTSWPRPRRVAQRNSLFRGSDRELDADDEAVADEARSSGRGNRAGAGLWPPWPYWP